MSLFKPRTMRLDMVGLTCLIYFEQSEKHGVYRQCCPISSIIMRLGWWIIEINVSTTFSYPEYLSISFITLKKICPHQLVRHEKQKPFSYSWPAFKLIIETYSTPLDGKFHHLLLLDVLHFWPARHFGVPDAVHQLHTMQLRSLE